VPKFSSLLLFLGYHMFKSMIAAAMLAGFAVPAAATTTYDAFTSFDGTQGAGGFTYGSFDGTTFTAFTGDTGCSNKISGVVCLGDLPGAFASTTGAHQSGSVIVPGDALILHPGPNLGQDSAVLFTAPTAGVYTFDFSAFVADNNPSGVNILLFVPGTSLPLATLDAGNPTYSASGYTAMAVPAGFQFGFAVDYDGVYYNDSTGIRFTVGGPDASSGAVPEPASWAMMVGGFGLVGGAMRRRSGKLATA
jgi:hypothetical protein